MSISGGVIDPGSPIVPYVISAWRFALGREVGADRARRGEQVRLHVLSRVELTVWAAVGMRNRGEN
jgi:hypothetical protein